jgi:hypothetical protein
MATKAAFEHHTLDDFRARIRTIGLPTGSHYQVEFLLGGIDGARAVSMLADQVTLPGLTIMTAEQRTFGEITESAYGISYQPVSLSIILDNEVAAKTFFDTWANSVFDRKTRTIGYYDDYIRDVRITLMDKASKPIYTVVLREAYPKTINDIQLDYASREILRVNVILTFKYWEREYIGGQVKSPEDLIADLDESSRVEAEVRDANTYNEFGDAAGTGVFQFDPSNYGRSLSSFGGSMWLRGSTEVADR